MGTPRYRFERRLANIAFEQAVEKVTGRGSTSYFLVKAWRPAS